MEEGLPMSTHSFISFFNIDPLAITIFMLVGSIGLVVGLFASRFMAGDRQYTSFFYLFSLLIISVICMAAADHLVLLLGSWGISNVLLVRLMIHKREWQPAANAGRLAARTFMVGFACLATACLLLYAGTGKTSIQAILRANDVANPFITGAAILLVIAAMTQSAIWPFHRWLLSSLNSPTPVSAIMHAGLVNGGGVLLARFAPLYVAQPNLLMIIFITGVGTAFAGSLWKLMQSDVKRMLACSTMAQMGFMLAQCGLGLFPAAIAHLCWHGLFKANLFLASNSAQQEKRYANERSPSISQLFLAMICGFYGTYVFTLASNQMWSATDSSLVLFGMVWIAASQLVLKLQQGLTWKSIAIILAIITMTAGLYGFSIFAIEYMVSPLHLMQPQPLNIIHLVALAIALLMWIAMLFKKNIGTVSAVRNVFARCYVNALNASQPHPSTVTSFRNQYRYE
jgi:NAD(P)H-quinone oxidoreductase subunit 5